MIGGKNLYYWLTNNQTSRALHVALKDSSPTTGYTGYVPIKVSGVVIANAREGEGGIVSVSKFQLNP